MLVLKNARLVPELTEDFDGTCADIVIDGGVTWEILERLWKKGVEGFVLGKQILFEKNEDYRTIIQKVRNI